MTTPMPKSLRPQSSLLAGLWVCVLCLAGLSSWLVEGQKWKTNLGPCYRNCTADPEPRLCVFDFTEDIYAVLTGACKNCSKGVEKDCYSEQCVFADGVERTVYSINRQMPGPAIYVCVGDVIRVNLKVGLIGHAETLHWHGLPQALTPWHDGVAWVTQCPIIFGNTFTYEFPATPYGTYFYHSHAGINKVNGILGALVVYAPRHLDPHSPLYDYDLPEHVILLQDWMHVDAEYVLPGLATLRRGQGSDALLINGQGQFTNKITNQTTRTPLATFEVLQGTRYRFRIINSGSESCPIQLQIEDHEMTVIATDGDDLKPQKANSLYTLSGERYDVVVQTKVRPPRSAFWIYVRTVGPCQLRGTSEQWARLVYKDADSNANNAPIPAAPSVVSGRQLPAGTVVNSLGDCEPREQVCASELNALLKPDENKTLSTKDRPKADKLVFFRLKFTLRPPAQLFAENNYERFLTFGPTANLVGVLNDIAWAEPSAPLLTQPGQSATCNEGCIPGRCRDKAVCDCPHVVKVPYNKLIDIVVVDQTDIRLGDNSSTLLSHPMHLHGGPFVPMGMGTMRNILNGTERAKAVRYLAERNALPSAVEYPALKDVLVLPGGGWIWLRFRSDNRGVWFFHCHFQYHMASGMQAAIQVGESKDFAAPPPGFPTCGDYSPSEYYIT